MSTRAEQVAADWVARLDAGPLAPEAEAELDRWLAQDPRHAGAFARARAVFAQADRAAALGEGYDPDRYVRRETRKRRAWPMAWAAAAGVVLVLGAMAWLLPPRADEYRTALGEVRRLPLADGSVMTLNTSSFARVEFSEGLRRVQLVEGEALFDVARDQARPFVVEGGGARVRVLGTSFTVRHVPGSGVEVLVREGHVQLEAPDAAAGARPLSLTASMKAVTGPGGAARVERVEGAALTRHLTWRDGMIAFNGDSLADAAREFTRYSRVRIVIDDPEVAEMEVVGLYASGDPAGFAEAVALGLGLAAHRSGNEVHLSRRE